MPCPEGAEHPQLLGVEDEELLAFSREKTLLCWECAEESRVCGGSWDLLC